jgi:hypothetical protein
VISHALDNFEEVHTKVLRSSSDSGYGSAADTIIDRRHWVMVPLADMINSNCFPSAEVEFNEETGVWKTIDSMYKGEETVISSDKVDTHMRLRSMASVMIHFMIFLVLNSSASLYRGGRTRLQAIYPA